MRLLPLCKGDHKSIHKGVLLYYIVEFYIDKISSNKE